MSRSPALLLLALAASCAAASSPGPADVAATADVAAVPDLPADVPDVSGPCTLLFGTPNEKTGLDATRCAPACRCDGKDFAPAPLTGDRLAALEARVLLDPPQAPADDPYAGPAPASAPPGTVCAVLPDASVAGGYRLATYDGDAAAAAAGAVVTHTGACGLCSPLVDLAVYARHPDLTAPVRDCGFVGMAGGEAEHLKCLADLGFDAACARIWYWNTRHTQEACGSVCMKLLDAPYHEPDGRLNACLQCDEDESGAVFKAVAGRTRRNTGLPSSMCRPCGEVVPLAHVYP